MHRVIKFRMWTGKTMLYDHKNVIECIRQQNFFNDGEKIAPQIGVWPYDHVGDGSTFMQLTGMIDSKVNPVWEGDLIKYLNSETTSTESGFDCEEFETIGEIFYDDKLGQWDVTGRIDVTREEAFEDFEVMGNKFEHPQLLKQD